MHIAHSLGFYKRSRLEYSHCTPSAATLTAFYFIHCHGPQQDAASLVLLHQQNLGFVSASVHVEQGYLIFLPSYGIGRPAEESFHSRHYSYSNYYPFQHKAFSTTLLSTDTAVSSSHRNTQSAPKRDHSSSSHLSSLSESSDDSLTTFPSSPLALSTSLSSSISNGNSSADSITVLSSLAKTTTTAAPQFYPDAINTLISASDRAQKKEPPCLAYLNDMPGPQLIDRRFDTEPVLTENIATKVSYRR